MYFIAALTLAAATFSPADLVGKWDGTYSCDSGRSGQVKLKIEKAKTIYEASWGVTESLGAARESSHGWTPILSEPGRPGLYRARIQLRTTNIFRLASMDLLLDFSARGQVRAISHSADLGALSQLASFKGRTLLTRGALTMSHKTLSPILNESCSGRFLRRDKK